MVDIQKTEVPYINLQIVVTWSFLGAEFLDQNILKQHHIMDADAYIIQLPERCQIHFFKRNMECGA